jgi:hypothetical protein
MLLSIELQIAPEFQKTFSDFTETQKDVNSLIEQSKKEIIIFSSIKILNLYMQNYKIWEHFSFLLKKDVHIKIITDDFSSDFLKQISEINHINKNNPIQIGYANKLGNIKEFVIISDGKYLLEINYDNIHNFVEFFSNKYYQIQTQEILFEKYWNEVKSLIDTNTN